MTFEEIYNTMRKYFEKNIKKKNLKEFGQGIYSYEFDVTGEGEG